MPKEETIQAIKIRGVVGEKDNLPSLNARSTLSSLFKAMLLKISGVPQLIHLYGALGLNKTLTFDIGENTVTSLFSDGTYLYAGLGTNPGKIVKIDLNTFTKSSTLNLTTPSGVEYLFSDGTYLYAGLTIGNVAKINLSTFVEDSTLNLSANEIFSLFSDGTFLYAGGNDSNVYKIDLNTFTLSNTLTLVGSVTSLFSDGAYLYAGLYTTPGKIVKIDLDTFTISSTLTLNTGENNVNSLFSDGSYLYAGTVPIISPPAFLIKIDLNSFTKVSSLSITGNYRLFSDGTYLYNEAFKIDISTFKDVASITYVSNVKALFSDGTYLYAGLNSVPGKVVRTYIIPTTDLHKRKIDLIDEQVHTGYYYIYPANAGVAVASGAGSYVKGNYSIIIPADTVLTTYYITGITITNMTVNTDYVFDIAMGSPEVVIATVSNMTENTNRQDEISFSNPIKIPSNTAISVRSSDVTGSLTSIIKIRYKT